MKRLLFAIVALCCVQLVPARARADAASSVDDFVRAFNSGNAASIAVYLQAHAAKAPPGPAQRGDTAEELARLRAAIGPVTVEGVRDLPRRVTVTVRARAGWYGFDFAKAPPGGGGPEFTGVSAGLAPPPKPHGQSDDAYLRSVASAGFFSGAVLVAEPGLAPYVGAFGLANRATGAANSAETQFNVASIGKLFTTAAVYQLVESGKLHLGDTIGTWLPDYPNDAARGATVQQLLDMSSGIGDVFGPAFLRADRARIRSLRDYLPFFAADPLLFAPGTGKAYSNGGFIVLGLIVERASGEDFYAYVRRHVFDPAGMRRTAYPLLGESSADRALGYTRGGTEVPTWSTPVRESAPLEPGRGSSAGGAYSTVGDLYAFARAARDGTLVKGRYAWNGPGTLLGGAPGWNAVLSVRDGITTVVLSNQDPPLAERVAEALAPAR